MGDPTGFPIPERMSAQLAERIGVGSPWSSRPSSEISSRCSVYRYAGFPLPHTSLLSLGVGNNYTCKSCLIHRPVSPCQACPWGHRKDGMLITNCTWFGDECWEMDYVYSRNSVLAGCCIHIYSVRPQASKGNVASEANDIPESFDMPLVQT